MNIYKEVINNYEDLRTRNIPNNHISVIFPVLNKEKVLYENARDTTVFYVRLSILLTILLLLRDTKHHLFLKVRTQKIHK
jgi:hypothetical protein